MNKPGFKLKIVLQLFRVFKYLHKKNHELSYFFWECTLRCNLSCLHCGSDCRADSETADMPVEDFIKVLDEVAAQHDARKILVAVTGGEPLLRNDLETFGRIISKKGFHWGIVSNGYSLDEKRFRSLLNSGLGSVTISIDGLEENHNWLRNRSDSFSKAVSAISIIVNARQTRSFFFDVVTCVNERNFHELPLLKFFLASLGVTEWRLFTIFPKGRAEGNMELSLSCENMAALMEFIVLSNKEGTINTSFSCEGYIGNYENRARKGYFFCRSGINVASVLANGDISGCPSLRGDFIQGNIYSDSFLNLWNNGFVLMRNRKWLRTGDCRKCRDFPFCEGNGLHLRDEASGRLLRCHNNMISEGKRILKSRTDSAKP